ncbi:hypothetical protein ACWT_6163 [Actinoplanes sp. SE50]|uniref:hypothetical protein n=1 Tax=unclassified Actinoplanes TaxID=2626549 RepID=UPI00023ECD68|nr:MULTISPECIES: hypothetical protein [unclassified Actinoplanes]AEV87177.1 hypothetical protein ACPL_6295 [Actinoplanes sp. SE50/110]ATO85578.1 hypothetical protein ACWT_6163 [Actinoplanes sp. SE50]SLM02991.1 uncharacterized protein ACSP50_6276 [Actinoplanes sp. SE50/110]
MFRYYVSYMFQGGYGSIDIHSKNPITEQGDLLETKDLINQAAGRILPGLTVMAFSRYGSVQPKPQRAQR